MKQETENILHFPKGTHTAFWPAGFRAQLSPARTRTGTDCCRISRICDSCILSGVLLSKRGPWGPGKPSPWPHSRFSFYITRHSHQRTCISVTISLATELSRSLAALPSKREVHLVSPFTPETNSSSVLESPFKPQPNASLAPDKLVRDRSLFSVSFRGKNQKSLS